MSSKVYYRSPVVWNMIVFIVFSFLFLYLQEVFYNLSSIKNKELLMSFLKDHKTLIAVMVISIFSLYRLTRLSRFFVILTTLMSFSYTVINLNNEFSKIILVILFFYLLLAYYLYQFFSMDIQESYYNPKFDKSLLFDPMLEKITCELLPEEGGDPLVCGFLTNWSFEGCYMYFDTSYIPKGRYKLSVKFRGKVFSERVTIVSRLKNGEGAGLKFEGASHDRQNEQSLGWREFYGIIEHMGYFPELMR